MLQVSEILIYPIKSLGGVSVRQSLITDRGLQWDRRWMLVNNENQFLTQRQIPELCFFTTNFVDDGIIVANKKTNQSIFIPLVIDETLPTITVKIWDDECDAIVVAKELNDWFSLQLKISCKLVFMPNNSKRFVDKHYASKNEITSFSDGYPILLLGQSSLNFLNEKLVTKTQASNFRPNIVFTGGVAFAEDTMQSFTINDILFFGVKLCARCVVTTINQITAKAQKEPLKTLSVFRQVNNKIYFGQNVLPQTNGTIAIGNELKVLKTKPSIFELK